MGSGFNTDVRVGDQVFHVQTEDRGPAHPVIDTAIYLQGRVVHRRSTRYNPPTPSVESSDEVLHKRVEEQHRALIEDLRAGKLAAEIGEPEPRLRLFETTRAYALGKLTESGELDEALRRQPQYLKGVVPLRQWNRKKGRFRPKKTAAVTPARPLSRSASARMARGPAM